MFIILGIRLQKGSRNIGSDLFRYARVRSMAAIVRACGNRSGGDPGHSSARNSEDQVIRRIMKNQTARRQ